MRITKEIPISQIEIDRIPYGLTSLEYAKCLFIGSVFPPIKVARLKNGKYKILDGRHRYLAHKMCGMDKIRAKFSTEFYKGVINGNK